MKYLNAKQVAARYGLTVEWVRHCKELRKIARKAGKFLMFREDELEVFETRRSDVRGFDLEQQKTRAAKLAEAERNKRVRFTIQ